MNFFLRSSNSAHGRGAPAGGHDEETALVAAAQRSDKRAFDALVSAHRAPLRGFLTRRVGGEAMEDVFQETLLAAWVALPRFEPRVRFKSWLYRIALNKAADYCRAQKRLWARETGLDAGDNLRARDDVHAAVEQNETVQTALACLPDAQREVLELYYYAELTLPQIAQVLERNLNTVKYQFYRAHALAAQTLETPGRRQPDVSLGARGVVTE